MAEQKENLADAEKGHHRPDGPFSGYADEDRRLVPHLGVVAVYLGAAVAAGALLSRRKRKLPSEVPAKDLALLGIATHKLSRIVTHNKVTSPLRAPFVRYEESTGAAEVMEEARGEGARRELGELLTCPWCLGTWIGSSMTVAYLLWPRSTRMVASVFTVISVSDFLNHGYVASKEATQ